MPSLYAHERFGEQVLERLPSQIKALAEKYRTQYGIGLQGPDFLFFHSVWRENPVPKLGIAIHRQSAAGLFEAFGRTIRRTGADSMEAACALGTVCHFMLDSSCHRYVREWVRSTGVGHNEIETEFERYLYEKDGLDPLRFPVWDMVPTDGNTARCLAELYREYGIDEKTAARSLRHMRLAKRMFYAPTLRRQKVLRLLMRVSGRYEELRGYLMSLTPNPLCRESSRKLYELSCGAVEETAALIPEYYETVLGGGGQNPRFARNFN